MPASSHGAIAQQLAAIDQSVMVRSPSSKPAPRSNTSIIGTAKRSGNQCASSGIATIDAPKPVRP